jgi:hemoglobin
MDTLPEAKDIRAMHAEDLTMAHEKLIVFLAGWLGGPKLYAKTFGPMRIPEAHAHLDIGVAERDAWLLCMQKAVDEQPWEDGFKKYFMGAISIPAERIRQVCEARRV